MAAGEEGVLEPAPLGHQGTTVCMWGVEGVGAHAQMYEVVGCRIPRFSNSK
jgi:hypothetical protein